MIDFLKVVVLSFIESITEFLPVSSTGHLILVNDLVKLEPAGFANAFNVIIQLGAILAVVVVFFDRLNPFRRRTTALPKQYEAWNRQTRWYYRLTHGDKRTIELWKKVIIGVLPAAVFGFLFDDFIDEHLMNKTVVTFTLLGYGIAIILLERRNAGRQRYTYETTDDFTYGMALMIGLFQCLAMVPGTSRSAVTIIGAMLLGSGRLAAAEFSFFLAAPTMLGATALKVFKNLSGFSVQQWLLILVGFVLCFMIAYIVIKKFMAYIERHDFKIFGYYRIVLAGILLISMLF